MAARRAAASLEKDLLATRFFNRKAELKDLENALAPVIVADPGQMIVVTGPKDSGKSALIREYRRRQDRGDYRGIASYIDMRQRSNMDPRGFAASLAGSLSDSMDLKVKMGVKVLGALGKGNWNLEWSPKSGESDPLSTAMAWLEEYCLQRDLMKAEMWEGHWCGFLESYKDGFPTIFIDEANALSAWTALPGGEMLLDTLLRFLIRISKQECGAHVVLASSENFFKQWLLQSAAFRGHDVSVFSVGHLAEEEAKAFVLDRVPESTKLEVESLWDDVFAHLGGAILKLHRLVRLAHLAVKGGTSVSRGWEQEKRRLFADASFQVLQGFHPELIQRFGARDPPRWNKDDWNKVVKLIGSSKNGVVPYKSLLHVPGLDSMIEHDFLHFRAFSLSERELVSDEWPIVSPISPMAYQVMKMQ